MVHFYVSYICFTSIFSLKSQCENWLTAWDRTNLYMKSFLMNICISYIYMYITGVNAEEIYYTEWPQTHCIFIGYCYIMYNPSCIHDSCGSFTRSLCISDTNSMTLCLGYFCQHGNLWMLHQYLLCRVWYRMSWYRNALHITDPLWGESTGHQWIPLT